jgi:hypothetical protein
VAAVEFQFTSVSRQAHWEELNFQMELSASPLDLEIAQHRLPHFKTELVNLTHGYLLQVQQVFLMLFYLDLLVLVE